MPSSPRDRATSSAPSAEVRGLISFLLFIHLFVVVMGLAAYVQPSPLEERLRDLFAPYLVALNFDLKSTAYPTGRFYLTHDRETDVDAVIRIEAKLSDGTEQSLTIPEPGLWPPERRRHYQALANAAETLAENEDLQAALPRTIAGAVLRSWGAKTGDVRIDRHLPLGRADVESSDPKRHDPFDASRYSTVYDAHVLLSAGGQVDLIKKVAAGETAPVDKRTGEKKAGERGASGQPAGSASGERPAEGQQ
jgi:hypothetical protein